MLEGQRVRVVAERTSSDGTISQIVEDIDGESVQNREKNVRNYPTRLQGENNVERFNENGDVPVLNPPQYQNTGEQDEGEQQFSMVTNEDGSVDSVPVLHPPVYDVGAKIARREQGRPVVNGDDSDSDVPTLTPPSYDVPKTQNRR